jgi:hypothetical protein
MNNKFKIVQPKEHKNFASLLTAIRELPLPDRTYETFYLQHEKQCSLDAGPSDCQCSPCMFHESSDGRLQVLPNGNPPSLPLAYQGILIPESESHPEVITLVEITPRTDEDGQAYRQTFFMKCSYDKRLHRQKIEMAIFPGFTLEESVEGGTCMHEADRTEGHSDLEPSFSP